MRLMRPDQSGHVHAKPAHAYMRTHTYIHNLIQPQEDNEEDDEEAQIVGETNRHQVGGCVCVCVWNLSKEGVICVKDRGYHALYN